MISMEQGMKLLTEANTSGSHDFVVMIPTKFTPPRRFYFWSTRGIWIKEQKGKGAYTASDNTL